MDQPLLPSQPSQSSSDPVPLKPVQPQPELLSTWDLVKGWFHYSETIFLARATMLTGFLIAAAGAMDWSPLFNLDIDTGFSKHQLIWVGGTTLFKGIIDEIARRRNSSMDPIV